LITITYVKILLLAPHMAPQLAGKIISALACKKGEGVKNPTASVASYTALTFFLERVLYVYQILKDQFSILKNVQKRL